MIPLDTPLDIDLDIDLDDDSDLVDPAYGAR